MTLRNPDWLTLEVPDSPPWDGRTGSPHKGNRATSKRLTVGASAIRRVWIIGCQIESSCVTVETRIESLQILFRCINRKLLIDRITFNEFRTDLVATITETTDLNLKYTPLLIEGVLGVLPAVSDLMGMGV